MSTLFCSDVVEFKDDPAIVGVIVTTWDDVEAEVEHASQNVYIHTSMPPFVRKGWFHHERLCPGYVLVEFMLPRDGFCLIAGSSLRLRDRPLAVDRIVKRKTSDIQSGRVLSTSAECTLKPVCSLEEYASTRPILAQSHISTCGPYADEQQSSVNSRMHGFSERAPQSKALSSREGSDPLNVHAHEVRHVQEYRQDDYIIYQDWIGRVASVLDEITVRLTNGSTVVVENPEELEVPSFIPGTRSYELVQRLDRAGYYRYCRGARDLERDGKAGSEPTHYYYPGQHVRTKKGNLRRGRWKFGAYDAEVEPQGIVVDVRNIEIDVDWLSPNFLDSVQAQPAAPPHILDIDVLQRGDVILHDYSVVPSTSLAMTLQDGNHQSVTEFGSPVRFRDLAGAAVKYGQTFNRIPRSDTQGYDMNILYITSTRTKALVQWQDGTTSEEFSTLLIPTQNLIENDVWPGDKVSLKADEVKPDLLTFNAVLHAPTLGVVQSVDAAERLARIRWFQDSIFKFDPTESPQHHRALPSSKYGTISDSTTEVSLYEICAYDAFYPKLGDLAVASPISITATSRPRLSDYFGEVVELCLDGQIVVRCMGALEPQDVKVPVSQLTMIASVDSDVHGDFDATFDDDEDDESWSEEISDADDELDMSEENVPKPIDIQIEYEGGENMDLDDNEEAWTTDASDEMSSSSDTKESTDADGREMLRNDLTRLEKNRPRRQARGREGGSSAETETVSPGLLKNGAEQEIEEGIRTSSSKLPTPSPQLKNSNIDSAFRGMKEKPILIGFQTSNGAHSHGEEVGNPELSKDLPVNGGKVSESPSSNSPAPVPFLVLEESPPSDHHYLGDGYKAAANIAKKATKEHKMMNSSLPDGIFVRTWDSRLDLLRVLIIGPTGTPYEYAPFIFDLHLADTYPNVPPNVFFHSWTSGLGRINPNLYEDGKVCLSLLGTWPGDEKNEGWSKKSTILQVLVSLLGLVLVEEPYYNEAGLEVLVGSEDSRLASRMYSEKAYLMAKGFVKQALSESPGGFFEVVESLYRFRLGPRLLDRIIIDGQRLVCELPATPTPMDTGGTDLVFHGSGQENMNLEGVPSDSRCNNWAALTGKLSAGALIILKKHIEWLVAYEQRTTYDTIQGMDQREQQVEAMDFD